MESLLEVKDLHAYFFTDLGVVKAINGLNFKIQPGEIVGLAGESGCGKTVTTKCILGMLRAPGRIMDGEILFDGQDLLSLSADQMREVRGKDISVVVQDAMAALNPVIPVGEQVADIQLDHGVASSKKTAWERAAELLSKTGIPNAKERVRYYAHEFSGGMQQRAVIATGLACNPKFIIADEPTTGLDVTIQAQILALLAEAQAQMGSAVLYISHDLATVVNLCNRVMIMYAGEIVESAPTEEIATNPKHPYTRSLINSIPSLGETEQEFLPAIPGSPPDPINFPSGCRFHPRCPIAEFPICAEEKPDLLPTRGAGVAACHFRNELDIKEAQD